MRRRLKEYRAKIDSLIDAGQSNADWDSVIQEHLVQISFFQHERLVHLLVTLAFALMEVVCAIAAIVTQHVLAAVLMFLILVLLVPYVVHYYFLENETQRLYAQYDQLLALREEATQTNHSALSQQQVPPQQKGNS